MPGYIYFVLLNLQDIYNYTVTYYIHDWDHYRTQPVIVFK